MRVHRLRGWCPCSLSGSAAWGLQGRMVPCWLVRWAPSGPPGLSLVRRENICSWASQQTCHDWKRTHTYTYWAVAWLCHLLLHPPPAPAACTGWWPESGCRWLVRYPLQMEEDKRSHRLKDERNINRADAHLRLRHYPPCRLLIWTAWASSFHSAGKDPGNTHSLVTLLPSWHASAGLNMLSWANFNEFLVALGAAVFAVALQQLAQQGDALLHLQDGIRPLWDFLHPFLVLRIKW